MSIKRVSLKSFVSSRAFNCVVRRSSGRRSKAEVCRSSHFIAGASQKGVHTVVCYRRDCMKRGRLYLPDMKFEIRMLR